MISNRWLNKRQKHWERLDHLVRRARGTLAGFNGSELQELGLLYRQIASDLAIAREDRSSPQLAAYLNGLLGKSHNLLYLGHSTGSNALVRFYRESYPRLFRETAWLTATALGIFAVGAIVGWAVTARDPAFAHHILGPHMMDTIDRREMWTHSVLAMKPAAAAGITTNNLSVAFAAFAVGVTGIGTIWLLLSNGLLLGVLGAATLKAGMALSLWSFVAPHGVLELPAIFIAGGAGLEVARGLFFPGFLPRRESLARSGARAVKLLAGTIPLLLVAGAIEGFFSPTTAPVGMKFALGFALFGLLVPYLWGTGRKVEAE